MTRESPARDPRVPRSRPASPPFTTAVAPGVWLATRAGGPVSDLPADVAAAAGMARWRAEEFLAGRALLRVLLAAVVPAAAGAEVAAGVNGRPELAGWPEVGVSASHDGPVVAAAVAVGHAVGVDVQRIAAAPDERLVRRVVHRDLPPADRAEELTWVWTVQEACVKATGAGIGGLPWRIDVPPYRDRGRWGALSWRSLRESSAVPLSIAWGRT